MRDWRIWVLIGLVVLNLLISVWAAARPVVPVASLTNALYTAGGDTRVLLLRAQQLEQTLQEVAQENNRLREELKKAKGDGK